MLECANETRRFRLPRRKFQRWFSQILRRQGFNRSVRVQLVFISAGRSRRLYQKYGGINKATTVLAFCWQEGAKLPAAPRQYLGEIYLAPAVVERQFGRGQAYAEALQRLLVHGVLHLLGFNHGAAAAARRFQGRERALLIKLN